MPGNQNGSLTVKPTAPTELVEQIFSVMTLHYGAARLQTHWGDVGIGALKAYWATKLFGLDANAVTYALQRLPHFPPNPDEFREIAGRRLTHSTAKATHEGGYLEKNEALERIAEIKARFPCLGWKKLGVDADHE